jgi:hypothetical protein
MQNLKLMAPVIMSVAHYIAATEHEDFFNTLEDQEFTPYEQRVLTDWYNDDIGTTQEVKAIFRRIAYETDNSHIYTNAICIIYGITEEEN